MKNIKPLILVLLVTASHTVLAETRPTSPLRSQARADYIKSERVQLEKTTEVKLLEKIEESRLREEKNRMQKIDTLNFSVVKPESSENNQTQTF